MKNASIFIVDDTPTNVKVLVDSLKASGFKTLVAASGEWALQQVQRIRPDLILLDVMMPGIDGFETCQRLKANDATREIPVIFMTALTEETDKVKGFEVGGVDYVTKSLQYEEVIARVNAHLTIRKLQQQLQESEKQYRTLFENLQDVFYRIDTEGILILTSPSKVQFLGYLPEEALSMHFGHELFASSEDWQKFQTQLEEDGELDGFEAQFTCVDGSRLWGSASAQFYTDTAGHILGIEGVIRDISKRKQAEAQLLAAHNELKEKKGRVWA